MAAAGHIIDLVVRRTEEILTTRQGRSRFAPRVAKISSIVRGRIGQDLTIPERVVMDAAIDASRLEGVIPTHAPLGKHDQFNSHYRYFDQVSEAALRCFSMAN